MRPDRRADALSQVVEDQLTASGVGAGDRLLVAVSGGMDSCALLHTLTCSHYGDRLHVAHLNHHLRSGASEDADFVADLAHHHRLPCTVAHAQVARQAQDRQISVEMAARECRRAFLQQTAARTCCGWILLGHHANDQAETILMRLLRGTGGTGVPGMRPAAGQWLRPLLGCTRDMIRQYAREHGLTWREDPSNQDIRIPRNRIRHQLVPRLERLHNPQATAALGRTARLLADEDAYLSQQATEALQAARLEEDAGKTILEYDRMAGYHIAIQRRVLRQILQELAPTLAERYETIQQLLQIMKEGPGPMRTLGTGLQVQIAGRWLIMRRPRPPMASVPVACPGRTSLPGHSVEVETRWCSAAEFEQLQPTLDLSQAVIDAGPALGPLSLRQPRQGDRLCPMGLGGHHKKLSDCFIDAGWPRILRQDAVVLSRVEDEEILWVAGLARSEGYRVEPTSERLMYLRAIESPANNRHDGN